MKIRQLLYTLLKRGDVETFIKHCIKKSKCQQQKFGICFFGFMYLVSVYPMDRTLASLSIKTEFEMKSFLLSTGYLILKCEK